jgi:hypothetical protein
MPFSRIHPNGSIGPSARRRRPRWWNDGPCFLAGYRAVRVVVRRLGRGSLPRALCQLVCMPQKAARVDFESYRRWAKTAQGCDAVSKASTVQTG